MKTMNKEYKNNFINKVLKDGSVENVDSIPGCSIVFKGNNNEITFHEDSRFNSSMIVLLSDNKIKLGAASVFRNMTLYSYGSSIQIGDRFSCWGLEVRAEERGTSLLIGNDCMFSKGINIYPSDCHTIFDIETNECINKGGAVVIGDHVWCGINSFFTKNSKVGSDCIVGAGAFINKTFEENNVLLVGSPAKIVKSRVNWSRKSPSEY
ncbi:acetyltransferase [Enterobacteriaceae bacterium ML5]|nr:acetyltransferase [Enterobacteriaceae bacterium ML5]